MERYVLLENDNLILFIETSYIQCDFSEAVEQGLFHFSFPQRTPLL